MRELIEPLWGDVRTEFRCLLVPLTYGAELLDDQRVKSRAKHERGARYRPQRRRSKSCAEGVSAGPANEKAGLPQRFPSRIG
jgi:hypothetical protein